MRPLAAVLLACALGCGLHRSNHPRPLVGEVGVDPRAVRAWGPLQLAFALRFVGANDGAPMLTIWLRNAGREPVPIDLGRLRIRGYASSSSRSLQLVDPRGELGLLHVDPGASGREKIRLADPSPKDGLLTRVCIDLRGMIDAPSAPVCFAPSGDAEWTVSP